MSQKEKELFLQICAHRNPDTGRIEGLLDEGYATPQVLGWLFANRMAAVAYGVLKERELLSKLDREFRNSLRNALLLNERIHADYFRCIEELTEVLEGCGIPYALLKGAYLCPSLPSGYRISNDVDILVAPEAVGAVSAWLRSAGFRQGSMRNGVFVPATRRQIIESKMTRGETVPFFKAVGLPFLEYLEVDLNFSLDFKNSEDGILKGMLSRGALRSAGELRVRTLDRYDFLLHLCAHLYNEATTLPWIRMRRDMTFYKYWDIYGLLWEYSEAEKRELLARASEICMNRELFYCLDSLDAFFGTENLPKGVDRKDFGVVIAPAERKRYRYVESDPVKRFFSTDRVSLLEEVTE